CVAPLVGPAHPDRRAGTLGAASDVHGRAVHSGGRRPH
ncbi:MAG: hypothetical protein AVDCRST_MAG57-770, partial [uncultured Blastococcus sp.]